MSNKFPTIKDLLNALKISNTSMSLDDSDEITDPRKALILINRVNPTVGYPRHELMNLLQVPLNNWINQPATQELGIVDCVLLKDFAKTRFLCGVS
ncbi:hypothetical protein Ciccas_004906 [Cichlidogyrus casuarinus]|uniref:Uncharacterized protein n=1 Tax=Cichlidogyrus casuarinus TaxID=1844966 RepID=A0ABD2QB36_9PLAT